MKLYSLYKENVHGLERKITNEFLEKEYIFSFKETHKNSENKVQKQ